jgi:hypothetical protein
MFASAICDHFFQTFGHATRDANRQATSQATSDSDYWITVINEPIQDGVMWGLDYTSDPSLAPPAPTDDFILLPRTLDMEFRLHRNPVKKYFINPVLMVQESDEELDKTLECAICYEEIKLLNTVTLNCGHQFCHSCIKNTLQSHQRHYCSPSCALCRETMTTFVMKNEEIIEAVSVHCH